MIGESFEVILLFNKSQEVEQDKDYSDDVCPESSLLEEKLTKQQEIHHHNRSHLAKLLQPEAFNSEFASQFQFNVSSYENPQAVLDFFQSNVFKSKQTEILLWENFIPIQENLEIISQISDQFPHVAIIAVGEAEEELAILQVLQLGVQDYLDWSELTPKIFRRSVLKGISRQQKLNQRQKLIGNIKSDSNNNEEVYINIFNRNKNDQFVSHQITNRQITNKERPIKWYDLSNITFDGLIILSSNIIVNANQVFASMLGQTIDDLIGANCFDLVAKESQKLFWDRIVSNYSTPWETSLVTKEGSSLCVEVQIKLIDDSQKDLKLLALGDITQRKQAEADLQRRENSLRKQSQTLVQLAKSKTLLQQGNLNVALREITEAAAKTLEVERISVWLYDQDNSKLECVNLYEFTKNYHSCGKVLEQENYPTYFQALATERTINLADAANDPKTVELKSSYLQLHNIYSILHAQIWLWGRLVGVVSYEHVDKIRYWTLEEENFAASIADFVSLAIEASDRATTEKALRRSEGKLRAIFERSSIGIGLIDMSTRIVDANPALCLMLGYSHDQMYGKRFTDYISPDELKSDLELYQQLIAGMCDRFEMERRFVRRDGRIVWTFLSVSLLPSTDAESKLFLAIIEDITERKHTELKLRHSKEAAEAGSRAKSEFLATMSHELRTPLNAIMGLSQLLLQNIMGELNDKQKEYVSCIYTSGEHLLALINDILDLSKVEAGREELLLAPLVIQDLCQVVIATVSDRAQEKGLELILDIDPQAKICIADERRMKQMLLNLLTNAVKFTSKGKISLLVKKVGNGINFIVSDTGIGIDSSQFKSLFEPFKQLDSRLNRHYEGTGLGLALTRKLIQLHGGEITLKSKVGKGSNFTLFLPDRNVKDEWGAILQNDLEEDGIDDISTNSLLSARTKRIALIEDEVHTANLLQDYLQTFGYRVEQFDPVEDCFVKIRSYLPDLILLSTELEGDYNGWDIFLQLRQHQSLQDLPIIIMTPMGQSKEYPESLQSDRAKMKLLAEAEETGKIGYLSKPIRTVQLESILMRYLSSS